MGEDNGSNNDDADNILSLPYNELKKRVDDAGFRKAYLHSRYITTFYRKRLWKAMLDTALWRIKRETNKKIAVLQKDLGESIRPPTENEKKKIEDPGSTIEYWRREDAPIVSILGEIEAMSRWFSIKGMDQEWVADHLRAASCSEEDVDRILHDLFFEKPRIYGDQLPLTDHEIGREDKRKEMEQLLRNGVTIVVVVGEPLIGKSTAVGKLAKDLLNGYWTTDGERNDLSGIISIEIKHRDESGKEPKKKPPDRWQDAEVDEYPEDMSLDAGQITVSGEVLKDELKNVRPGDETSESLMNRLYRACLHSRGDPPGLRELLFDYQKDPEEKIHALRKALERDNYLIIVTHVDELLTEEGKFKDAFSLFAEFLFSCLRSEEISPRFLMTSTRRLTMGCETVNSVKEVKLEELSEEEGVELLRFFDPDGTYGLKDEDEEVLRDLVRQAIRKPFLLMHFVDQWKQCRQSGQGATIQEIMAYVREQKEDELVDRHYSYLPGPRKCVIDSLAVLDVAAPEGLIVHLRPSYYREAEVSLALSELVDYRLVTVSESDSPFGKEFELIPLFKERIRKKFLEERPSVFADISSRAAAYYEERQINVQQWRSAADAIPQVRAFYLHLQAEQYDQAVQLYLDLTYSPLIKWGFIETFSNLYDMILKLSDEALGPGRGASLMSRHAHLLSMQGKYREAIDEFEKVIVEAQQERDIKTQAFAFMKLAYLTAAHPETNGSNSRESNLSRACEYFHDAAMLTEHLNEGYERRVLEYKIFLGLARIYHQQMRIDDALESAHRALEAAGHIDKSARLKFHSLAKVGVIYRLNGDFEEADEVDEQIRKLAGETNTESVHAEVNSRQGHLFRYKGEFIRALEQHRSSFLLYSGPPTRNVAVQQVYMGNQYLALGEISEAIEQYISALDIAKQLRLHQEVSWFTNCLAAAYTVKGAYDKALRLHKTELNASQGWSEVVRHTERAYTNLLKGDDAAAWDAMREAIQETAQLQEQVPGEDFPELFLKLPYTHDFPDYEMPVPGQYQRQGTILARLYMNREEWANALDIIRKVREHTVVPYRHQAAAIEGVIQLRLGDGDRAQQAFDEACSFAEQMLAVNDGRFPDAGFTLGLAHCGRALCDMGSDTTYIDLAVAAYNQARQYSEVSTDEPLQLLELLEPLNPELIEQPLRILRLAA
ncbi:MAG: hypothetical protein JXJ17_01835 [Anaerolineae bacterium]|nr:hypothetical protein [Anaerolineae bacterium]